MIEIKLRGKFKYWQDFRMWENDFGKRGKSFELKEITSNGCLRLEADGYGSKKKYGNGHIYLIIDKNKENEQKD